MHLIGVQFCGMHHEVELSAQGFLDRDFFFCSFVVKVCHLWGGGVTRCGVLKISTILEDMNMICKCFT